MTVTWTDDGIGRVLDARYRLVALIGAGASARVYLADDLRLRRQVAVKILHPTLTHDQVFLRRFEQEARAAAAFNHPHVVAVHDWGDTDAGPYLVTEYLAGGSLRALLTSGARLSPSQAVKVGLEAASGLAAAHRRGMVHRDIKPANLLFGSGSRLRVADFGLVQALSEAALTEPDGVILGTVAYSGPERVRPGVTDGRTDVYSLAVSLVEAVTGEVPLSEGTAAEILARRADTPIPVPDEFGAARDALAAAGAVEVEDRPTAEQLMHQLVRSTEHFEAPVRLPLAGAIRSGTPVPQFDITVEDPDLADATAPAALVGGGDATVLAPAQVAPGSQPLAPEGSGRRSGRVWWLLGVLLVLGAGAVGAGLMVSSVEPPPVETVPLGDLRGMPIADVRALAAENEWTLDEDQVRSDTLDIDTVVRQNPGPGSELAAGASVSVDVVSRPLQRLAPWLIGLDVEDAVARLEARGFVVGARDPRFDEIAPAGEVMEALIGESTVTGGILLEPGTTFDLVVSQGPIPRTVPEVVGVTVEEATSRLQAVGLSIAVSDPEFSETVPVDEIISQSIPSGSQVDRGSTVTVVASKGPDRRVVPEVAGLSIEEATARLEAVGLIRSGVSGGGNVVENASPRPGTLLKPGEGVELFAPR